MKNYVCIDRKLIQTEAKEIARANIMTFEAGTNGYQGGDSGNGSRTYLAIMDEGGTDIRVHALTDKYGCEGVEIILGGDHELQTIIEGLEFLAETLRKQSKEEAR